MYSVPENNSSPQLIKTSQTLVLKRMKNVDVRYSLSEKSQQSFYIQGVTEGCCSNLALALVIGPVTLRGKGFTPERVQLVVSDKTKA